MFSPWATNQPASLLSGTDAVFLPHASTLQTRRHAKRGAPTCVSSVIIWLSTTGLEVRFVFSNSLLAIVTNPSANPSGGRYARGALRGPLRAGRPQGGPRYASGGRCARGALRGPLRAWRPLLMLRDLGHSMTEKHPLDTKSREQSILGRVHIS